MVAIHCGLRSRAIVCGAAPRRNRGSIHMLIASVAKARLRATIVSVGRKPKTLATASVTTRATPSAARAAMKAR